MKLRPSPQPSPKGRGGLCAGALVIAAACGADQLQAPRPPEQETLAQCSSIETLMPLFLKAISSGQTEGLRRVVKEHLLVADRPGEPPPINFALRGIFGTLATFARLPPEGGAGAGEVCASEAPDPRFAHPLCEMRRAMDLMVHEGKSVEALTLADPQISGVMSYILGRPPASSTPHFEVATVVANMCQQNAVCQLSDGLELLAALAAFAITPEGATAVDHLQTLIDNPALQPFLTNDGAQYGGENGMVALVRVVISTTLGMENPSELDDLPVNALPPEVQPDAWAAIADLKILLDPNRHPNVLRPLKKVLHCYEVQDPNGDLVRMGYRLGLEAKLPEFGLTRIVSTVQGLRQTDPRGTVLHLVRTFAEALRRDEEAVDATAAVCRTLFSTRVPAGQTRSNAQLALPVVADLFSQGVAAEAVCALDTLVYGCAGGAQPACTR